MNEHKNEHKNEEQKDRESEDVLKEEHKEKVEDLKDEEERDNEPHGENSSSQEIADLKNQLLRLQADFVNYKNRVERERKNSILYANEDLLQKLLPILDNFDRAMENAPKDEFAQGVELIHREFLEALESTGLEAIDSDGTPFDPNLHHAIVTEAQDDVESGIVLETFQKGYRLKDRILRPSTVKVSE